MSDFFDAIIDSVDGWGVLLVDASNAFNSLTHTAMLLYMLVFCGLAVLVFFLFLIVASLCLYLGAI